MTTKQAEQIDWLFSIPGHPICIACGWCKKCEPIDPEWEKEPTKHRLHVKLETRLEMQRDVFGDIAELAREHAPYEEIEIRARIMATK